jgi:hypothetical protein
MMLYGILRNEFFRKNRVGCAQPFPVQVFSRILTCLATCCLTGRMLDSYCTSFLFHL